MISMASSKVFAPFSRDSMDWVIKSRDRGEKSVE